MRKGGGSGNQGHQGQVVKIVHFGKEGAMNKCEYCQKPIDHFNEDYLVLYRTRRDE